MPVLIIAIVKGSRFTYMMSSLERVNAIMGLKSLQIIKTLRQVQNIRGLRKNARLNKPSRDKEKNKE